MHSTSYETAEFLTTVESTVESRHSTRPLEWRSEVPILRGLGVTLRELRDTDAAALFAVLGTQEVSQFLSPPPSTLQGFERFIRWSESERRNGRYVCFVVVPDGLQAPVGLFQVRALDSEFATAEWGFLLDSAFWGTGLFRKGAELVVDFAFDVLGVHRLEARSLAQNGRGNGALSKIGAVQEGVVRQSFLWRGEYHDQILWSLLKEDWRQSLFSTPTIH